MAENLGRLELEITADASEAKKAIKDTETASKKSCDAIKSEASDVAKKIDAILNDSNRSMKSKTGALAGIYKKQGLDASAAMKKAWSEIERDSAKSSKVFDSKAPNRFAKEMKSVEKQSNSLGATFGKLGRVIASVFAVHKIANFTKSCLELGSNLAEVQNVVDVTFGSMNKNLNEWAKNAMSSYGLSETLAKKYASMYGAMAKATGYTTQEAYDMSTALAGLAGDVASFYNLSADEAYTKLKSVFSGETETLKDLGIVMTQSALDAYALANGFGKTTAAMSEQEKVGLRLAFVQNALNDASGDFARTSGSWANQVKVLSLQWDSFKASIGQGLINVLTPALQALNRLMSVVSKVAEAFANFTALIFGDAGSASSSTITSDAASGLSSVADSAGIAADATKGASAAAKEYKKQLMGFDELNIISAPSTSGSSGSGGSGGSGGATSSTTSLQTTVDEANTTNSVLDTIKDKLLNIANITGLTGFWNNFIEGWNSIDTDAIKENLKSIWQEVVPISQTASTGSLQVLSSFLGMAGTISGGAVSVAGKSIETATGGVRRFLESESGKIQTWITETSDKISTGFDNLDFSADTIFGSLWSALDENQIEIEESLGKGLTAISKWGTWLGTVASECWLSITGGIKSFAEENGIEIDRFWNNLCTTFSEGVTFISNRAEFLLTGAKWLWENIGKPIFDNVVKSSKNTASTVIKFVNDLMGKFNGALKFINGIFAGDWKKAWSGIVDMFLDKWVLLKTSIRAPLNNIIGFLNGLISGTTKGLNKIIDALNKFKVTIPSWVPEFGGKSIGFSLSKVSTVSIPYLATGGYVKANTPQLAVVGDNKHEGEIIAPESKITQAVMLALAPFMGLLDKLTKVISTDSVGNIHLTLMLDGKVIFDDVVKRNNDTVKRTGNSPLLT